MTVLLMKMNLRYQHPSPPLGNDILQTYQVVQPTNISIATNTAHCLQIKFFTQHNLKYLIWDSFWQATPLAEYQSHRRDDGKTVRGVFITGEWVVEAGEAYYGGKSGLTRTGTKHGAKTPQSGSHLTLAGNILRLRSHQSRKCQENVIVIIREIGHCFLSLRLFQVRTGVAYWSSTCWWL